MDVFKYLKKADTLIKEGAADDAREMGLEYAGYGKWKDPKTGQVTHRSVKQGGQTTLQKVDAPEQPQKQEPQQPDQPKSLSDFRKDAPKPEQQQEVPSVADQEAKVVPGGPDEKAFASGNTGTIAKMMARGRENVMSPTRKTQLSQQAQRAQKIYDAEQEAIAAQAEAEAQAAADQEIKDAEALAKEMGTPEGPLKDPSEFKTLTQAVTETGKNFDGSESVGDVDVATEESIKRVSDISKTDVNDPRFDSGRKSQKQFLSHYGEDSENRSGLNTLSKSVARANDRTKVNDMMDALKEGDYMREIELKKGDKRSVSELLLDAGIDVNDEDQVKQFVDAYDQISQFIGEDGNWKKGESHELVGSNLGYYEAKHIAERDDLKELDVPDIQTKAFNVAADSESSMANMDPVVTDAVYSILPTPARDFLAKSGSPKTFYDPREESGQGKPNPIRGSAALHMWAMQDGKDAYALSGQRRSPGEFQVEHIQPLKSGGTDSIDNFGMLLRRVNEPRADLGFDKFSEQAKRKRDSVDSDLASPKTRQRLEKGYRASSFNSELASSMGGAISGLTSDDLMKKVNQGLESSLGKESSRALKVTPEAFKQYQDEMQGFLDKNELDGDANVSDMTSEQINGVFDIMSDNLGVSKTKMNDYMGRNLINNYDVGARFVINKDGKLEKGRGGTSPSSGNVVNMQNSIMSDDSMSPEDKKKAIQTANEHHQQIKRSRNDYIENPDSPESYEKYLGDIVTQIGYLTGDGDSPLKPGRKYDTRLTPSTKNNLDNDTSNGIMNLLSLDTASVAGGKDAFSPGFQQTPLSPKAKKHVGTLRKKLLDSYTKQSGFTQSQIDNPDSLTKTQRKKIEPLLNALENIDRGLQND